MEVRGLNSSAGLTVCIFENKKFGNCSNNGLSSKVSEVTIVSDDFPIVALFEVTDEVPAVVIVDRRDLRAYKDIIAVPRDIYKSGKHYMFGGSFIYSSDSRFREISEQPIKLFDRVEN